MRFGRHCEGLGSEASERAIPQCFDLVSRPYPHIRHVRLLEPLTFIPIRDRNGPVFRGCWGDSNYRYDMWELPDEKWVSEIVSIYDAHHPQWQSAVRIACPTARKILSACLAMRLWRIRTGPHPHPTANMLKAWRARQVRIYERGRVFAPGVPARTARTARCKPRKRT